MLRSIEAVFGTSMLRADLFPYSSQWSLTTMDLLLYMLAIFSPQEVFRVSKPGIDQSKEVWFVVVLGILQLMAFVLGTFAYMVNVVPWLHVFANFENLGFAIVTLGCSYYTYRINVRSMQRSFVQGA